jgi:1,4-alpha-glucan branching enzyme
MVNMYWDAINNRPAANSPWFNAICPHEPYCWGYDFDHTQQATKDYIDRVNSFWLEEYKVDGFRFDYTKGFINNGNGFSTDRINILKRMADSIWSVKPNAYVILEHWCDNAEEKQLAEYGMMLWGNLTHSYNDATMGYTSTSNISNGIYTARTWTVPHLVTYMESHDEERVAFKAFNEAGQTQGNLTKVHQRLQAMGSVLFLVPGPKMIWHFGDLGWEYSLFTCSNGTVQYNDGCKLDTKPQPQWTGNWLTNTNRSAIYNSWAKMIDMKKTENVFENGTYAWNIGNTGRPRLDVWTSQTQTSALSYVFVLTNFSDATYNVQGGFPFTGTWANLMDNTTFNVSNVNMNISIEPGGYRVFGNRALLNNDTFDALDFVALSPNPASTYFTINTLVEKVQIYSITGQLVKSFSSASINDSFSIEDLTKGVYIVKISDPNNREKTLRLIKE